MAGHAAPPGARTRARHRASRWTSPHSAPCPHVPAAPVCRAAHESVFATPPWQGRSTAGQTSAHGARASGSGRDRSRRSAAGAGWPRTSARCRLVSNPCLRGSRACRAMGRPPCLPAPRAGVRPAGWPTSAPEWFRWRHRFLHAAARRTSRPCRESSPHAPRRGRGWRGPGPHPPARQRSWCPDKWVTRAARSAPEKCCSYV